jgi:hypothetical protein
MRRAGWRHVAVSDAERGNRSRAAKISSVDLPREVCRQGFDRRYASPDVLFAMPVAAIPDELNSRRIAVTVTRESSGCVWAENQAHSQRQHRPAEQHARSDTISQALRRRDQIAKNITRKFAIGNSNSGDFSQMVMSTIVYR